MYVACSHWLSFQRGVARSVLEGGWAGPYWGPPGALMGQALVVHPGPLWAGPLWPPLGPHGLGPNGPSWATYIYIYTYLFKTEAQGGDVAFFNCT